MTYVSNENNALKQIKNRRVVARICTNTDEIITALLKPLPKRNTPRSKIGIHIPCFSI